MSHPSQFNTLPANATLPLPAPAFLSPVAIFLRSYLNTLRVKFRLEYAAGLSGNTAEHARLGKIIDRVLKQLMRGIISPHPEVRAAVEAAWEEMKLRMAGREARAREERARRRRERERVRRVEVEARLRRERWTLAAEAQSLAPAWRETAHRARMICLRRDFGVVSLASSPSPPPQQTDPWSTG
ncbi:hypothetical protein LTR85_003582 [Meristemomyces frigidus]|nr:hypothetical protein LTR85_003582 [Meristemomyces frigidus]